jgi:hypothetical protein
MDVYIASVRDTAPTRIAFSNTDLVSRDIEELGVIVESSSSESRSVERGFLLIRLKEVVN